MPSRPDPTIQTLIDGSQITVDPTRVQDESDKKRKAKQERRQERSNRQSLAAELETFDDDMPGADHI